MTTPDIDNVNITAFDAMTTPEEINARLPLSDKAARTVSHDCIYGQILHSIVYELFSAIANHYRSFICLTNCCQRKAQEGNGTFSHNDLAARG